MKNFAIFFHEKEGTSALVRLLDNFDNVSVVHQIDGTGWEPFDRHNCGDITLADLRACLTGVYGPQPLDIERLNSIYTKTSTKALEVFDKSASVGFKMRFIPIAKIPAYAKPLTDRSARVREMVRGKIRRDFERTMVDVLVKNNVVVFIAARQDIFRLALSKYHGDGSGKRGHMQFKVAAGELSKDEIPRITVDCDRFEFFIKECQQEHADKRALADMLKKNGLEVHALRYEDFLTDKKSYFHRMLGILGREVTDEAIDAAIAKGAFFEKVHSEDISEFIENHEEVTARFGDCFEAW